MMSNPLYQQMSGQNGMQQIVDRFRQFQRMFSGDPRQQVQELLNSGKVSQGQYNQAVQLAQQLQRMIGK